MEPTINNTGWNSEFFNTLSLVIIDPDRLANSTRIIKIIDFLTVKMDYR